MYQGKEMIRDKVAKDKDGVNLEAESSSQINQSHLWTHRSSRLSSLHSSFTIGFISLDIFGSSFLSWDYWTIVTEPKGRTLLVMSTPVIRKKKEGR